MSVRTPGGGGVAGQGWCLYGKEAVARVSWAEEVQLDVDATANSLVEMAIECVYGCVRARLYVCLMGVASCVNAFLGLPFTHNHIFVVVTFSWPIAIHCLSSSAAIVHTDYTAKPVC
jgi:hypothetical protein